LGAKILESDRTLADLNQALDLFKIVTRQLSGRIHYDVEAPRDLFWRKMSAHDTGNPVMMPSLPGSTISGAEEVAEIVAATAVVSSIGWFVI
jgi:hypothetical protein